MICCNNDYGTPLNSSYFNRNQRNLMKLIYEEEYAALLKSNERSTYEYWEDKDDARYYNELLNELDAENQKPIDYPNITEKLLLIFAASFCFYISFATTTDFSTYENVPLSSLAFPFYFLIKESVTVGFVGRSFIRVSKYYNHLDEFVHKNFKPYEDILQYHGVKLRIFSLDNKKNTWTIILLVLDIAFHSVMTFFAFALKYIKKDTYGSNIFEPDAFFYFLICALPTIFSCVYLKIAVDNWEWLRKAKPLLYSNI